MMYAMLQSLYIPKLLRDRYLFRLHLAYQVRLATILYLRHLHRFKWQSSSLSITIITSLLGSNSRDSNSHIVRHIPFGFVVAFILNGSCLEFVSSDVALLIQSFIVQPVNSISDTSFLQSFHF